MNLIEFTGEELQAELDRRRLERMLKGVEDTDLETELTQRMVARMKREEERKESHFIEWRDEYGKLHRKNKKDFWKESI